MEENRERRQRTRTAPKAEPEIHYTQPKIFNRKHLLRQLLTLVLVVLAIAVSISVFFKVREVKVAGAERYSVLTVVEASGIEVGDSLLFFGRGMAANKIIDALPYVKDVQFQVELPGTVHIIIEEKPIAYAVVAEDGSWWLMTSDGILAEKLQGEFPATAAVISGFALEKPQVGAAAKAAELQQEGSATAADRLNTALTIMQQLEKNAFFDNIACIDVSDLFDVQLYYGTQYRVMLGDWKNMGEKIVQIKNAITQLGELQSGDLILSQKDEQWQVIHRNPSNS